MMTTLKAATLFGQLLLALHGNLNLLESAHVAHDRKQTVNVEKKEN